MIHWGKDCNKKIAELEEAYKKELERTNVDFLHNLTTYKLQIQALNKELNELKESQSTYKTPKEIIIEELCPFPKIKKPVKIKPSLVTLQTKKAAKSNEATV